MQGAVPFSGSAELGVIERIKITFKEQYLLGEVERYYTHLRVGIFKRVQETADKLIEMVKKRGKLPTENERGTFFSYGNDQYTNALFKDFDRKIINYRQLIKIRDNGRIVARINWELRLDTSSLLTIDEDSFLLFLLEHLHITS